MGGPSYATPMPVKRSDGTQIIWDWNKKDFVPYTAPDPNAAQAIPAAGTPEGGAGDQGRSGEIGPGGAPSGGGPGSSPGGAPGGSQDISITQRRRRTAGGVSYAPGSSLLTMRGGDS